MHCKPENQISQHGVQRFRYASLVL